LSEKNTKFQLFCASSLCKLLFFIFLSFFRFNTTYHFGNDNAADFLALESSFAIYFFLLVSLDFFFFLISDFAVIIQPFALNYAI
jgi:hypothetical protein